MAQSTSRAGVLPKSPKSLPLVWSSIFVHRGGPLRLCGRHSGAFSGVSYVSSGLSWGSLASSSFSTGLIFTSSGLSWATSAALGLSWALSGVSWTSLELLLGLSWALLELSWALLSSLGALLALSWCSFRLSWAFLGLCRCDCKLRQRLHMFHGTHRSLHWASLGPLLGLSFDFLGPPGGLLAPLGAPSGFLGALGALSVRL